MGPPTIGKEILEQIVKEMSKPEEGLTILPVGKGDRWAVDFHPAAATEEIPHYLEVEIEEESHTTDAVKRQTHCLSAV
jgi:hypothetical protein